MVMPIEKSLISSAGREETYKEAREGIICDYCGIKYCSGELLNQPFEVHYRVSKGTAKRRGIVVCRICAIMIHIYESKKSPTIVGTTL
jgi:hypothetical protein